MKSLSSKVYFIKPVGMDGPIKIGSSTCPEKRLESLAVWSPFPLEIIISVDGDLSDEQFIHSCFADVHSHKEWFKSSKLLLDTIDRIAKSRSLDWVRDELKPIGRIRNIGKGSRPCPEYRVGLRSYSARIRAAENRLRNAGIRQDHNSEASEIMHRWYGNSYRRIAGVRPSPSEFVKLEEYISSLNAKHSEINHKQDFPNAA
ncbi:GIY-YIG nuclease family protein [Brucella sp.]|uniref:GIY-YIG nuclease family protein n=1 Tax=Brucella sp. TaxID=52132 RepID=UPI0028B12E78|nr:GIY-YIG nuclease family protein [Brucella sp.]